MHEYHSSSSNEEFLKNFAKRVGETLDVGNSVPAPPLFLLHFIFITNDNIESWLQIQNIPVSTGWQNNDIEKLKNIMI